MCYKNTYNMLFTMYAQIILISTALIDLNMAS